MALKDKLMTLEDFKAVRDVDVASNSAQFTEIKADLVDVNESLGGVRASLTSIGLYDGDFFSNAINYQNGNVINSSLYRTDYVDLSGLTKIVYSRLFANSTATLAGMAFYDVNKEYISGQRIATGQESIWYQYEILDVPEGAVYARFSVRQDLGFQKFSVYDYELFKSSAFGKILESNSKIYELSAELVATNAKTVTDKTMDVENAPADAKTVGAIIGINKNNIDSTSHIASTGIEFNTGNTFSSSSLFATDYIDITGITKIEYTRLYSTSSSSKAGMVFYDTNKEYISGQRVVLKQSVTNYELEIIDVPEDAVYARFTGNKNLADFAVYDFSAYLTTIKGRIYDLEKAINEGKEKYPIYRVSILGDSISTFALEAGTGSGDKYAGANCETNYPSNRVRFPFNDVQTVEQMWWKIVLDTFGWALGINDSWAGSRITWQGGESTVTGENIYIGSPTRIGHLGENGTPDIIFVFGGTNDINHLSTANIGELPTDDPSAYTDTELNALPVSNFKDAVTALVLRLQHTYPDAQIIALIPYYVTQNYGTTPYTVKLFDDALIEVYDYLGVDYIDLRKIVNIYDISTLLGDSLHPNANGMKLIAEAVIHKIKNVIQISPH